MKALKRPHTKYSALTAGVAVLLCFVTFSVSTYAWLVNYVSSGNFGYQAGELPPYTLEIARIPYHAEEGHRVEEYRGYEECPKYRIEMNEDKSHLAVAIENMSFGTIDNVAQLKPENIDYIRLTVPKECGQKISVSLYYSSEKFIRLYKKIEDESENVTTSEVTDSGGEYADSGYYQSRGGCRQQLSAVRRRHFRCGMESGRNCRKHNICRGGKGLQPLPSENGNGRSFLKNPELRRKRRKLLRVYQSDTEPLRFWLFNRAFNDLYALFHVFLDRRVLRYVGHLSKRICEREFVGNRCALTEICR